MKRKKRNNRFNSKNRNIETAPISFTLFIKKIALGLGTVFILSFFTLIFTYEPRTKQISHPPLVQHKKPETIKVFATPIVHYSKPKPKKQPRPSKSSSKLTLLHKSDGDTLYIKKKELRITFKKNKLIASQKELFRESQINPNTLYCVLNGVNSRLNGQITNKLRKQSFSDKVTIKQNHHQLTLKIHIKASCEYKRSAWAKKSGLDLLTFSCE